MFKRFWNWFLDGITRASFSYWSPILTFFAIFSLAFIFLIPFTIASGWKGTASFVMALGFGVVSIIGTLTSIAVFHHVRGVLTHWTSVSDSFSTLVSRADSTLYVVSENPAFLQAFSEREFKRWVRPLQDRLGLHDGSPTLKKVVFLYPRREVLAGKIEQWSNGNADHKIRMMTQITYEHIFGWFFSSRREEISQVVRFVPLDVANLDYFIFVSDEQRSAIFCRSYVGENIAKSNLQGFRTVDRPLVEAFRHIISETVANAGCVYCYKCNESGLEYTFTDDQVLYYANFSSFEDLQDERLEVVSPSSGEPMVFKGRRLISALTEQSRENVLEHIFE